MSEKIDIKSSMEHAKAMLKELDNPNIKLSRAAAFFVGEVNQAHRLLALVGALEMARSVETRAMHEMQVEKLSGNIVKEEHWKGQMVAARIILREARALLPTKSEGEGETTPRTEEE